MRIVDDRYFTLGIQIVPAEGLKGAVKNALEGTEEHFCRPDESSHWGAYERKGEETFHSGLSIDLEAGGFHFLKF